MENNIPPEFARYTEAKYKKFNNWLQTKHGQAIYGMFRKFSFDYRDAGHTKTGANLIGNRVRWETDTSTEYTGFKVSNDFLPMMARQLVYDDPSFNDFFNFHKKKEVGK